MSSEAGKVEKWISRLTLAGIVIGFGAQQFWYVPYYLESKVRAQVTAELTANNVESAISAAEELAKANEAQVGAVLTRLDGMENRMIQRDAAFMEFLREERERRLANN